MLFRIKSSSIVFFLALKFTNLFPQDSLADRQSLPLSMSDAWMKAMDHSKKIQLIRSEAAIANKEIQEAQFERLPEVQLKGYMEHATNLAQYVHGLLNKPEQHEVIHFLYRTGFDSYLPVYHGNKLNLKVDKKKLLYQIAEEQKNFTISEIKLQTASYYLYLQQGLVFRALMIQDIANQEKQLKEIQSLRESGVVLKSDELRVQLKLSRQKLSLVEIENDIFIANQKLNIVIGLPDHQPINPIEQFNTSELLLRSYEEYLEEAMHKSFEYHISENQTKLAKVNLQYVKANVRPKVGLYGDMWLANPQIFLYPYSPYNYTLGLFGVRASIPISEIYMNRPKSAIANMEFEKEELAHHDMADKIRNQVYEAYLRLKESLVRIDVAKVNIDHAAENARIVKNNYFNQAALITDLLDADIQLLESKFELAAAQIDAQIKYYQLQNILGNL
jgi:outer membrane protein TolC